MSKLDGHPEPELKVVFNGRELHEDEPDLAQMLRATGDLGLRLQIDGLPWVGETQDHAAFFFAAARYGWYKGLVSMNSSLHALYQHLSSIQLKKIQLVVNHYRSIWVGEERMDDLISPAIALAVSVPQTELFIGDSWYPQDSDEAGTWRRLLDQLRQLRREMDLVNSFRATANPTVLSKSRRLTSGSEFESQWPEHIGFEQIHRLKTAAALQRSACRMRAWLDEQWSEDFDRSLQQPREDLQELQLLKATREGCS
ncbi:uncharacterized protein LTR77_006478 [Saxophila tyrrhenica]|uniref:Uncharacterized protein n=1 Tax=Saxophila tyrrhenica TaxID=1690608 RepID=A0AAV9P7Z8_9PEZI|nr:hypothetical protein LTR77_006478 [Saxophila tyrrhenica]